MQHNITLLEEEFKKIESGNRHIITRDNSLFAIEDILTIGLSGHREQMAFVIENIERKRLFKGWCLLEFKNIGDFFKNGVPEMILNEGTPSMLALKDSLDSLDAIDAYLGANL